MDSHAGSSEETGTGCGFSLGSCDDELSSTPMMAETNDMNIFNYRSINSSVKNNVHDLYK